MSSRLESKLYVTPSQGTESFIMQPNGKVGQVGEDEVYISSGDNKALLVIENDDIPAVIEFLQRFHQGVVERQSRCDELY